MGGGGVSGHWESDYIDFKQFICKKISDLNDTIQMHDAAINCHYEREFLKKENHNPQAEIYSLRESVRRLVSQVCGKHFNITNSTENINPTKFTNKRQNHSTEMKHISDDAAIKTSG